MIPATVLELDFKLDEIYSELEQDNNISSGVGVFGPAAAYALVWEFGNLRQHQQGPRTVMGVNLATGAQVWMSSQAPWGYVRASEADMWLVIEEEIKKARLGNTRAEVWKQLNEVATRIAVKCSRIIREAAPEDSGELKSNIIPLLPGDMAGMDETETTLVMTGGEE